MAVQVEHAAEPDVLIVKLSGRLDKEDYKKFVPEVERLIEKHGKVRLLVDMHDFHGWDAGALWEDMKFDLKHFSDIGRLGLVGEKKWEKGMATFCKPFTSAKIRYFDRAEEDAARAWVASSEDK